jgi:hypothetical protein
MRSGYGLSDCSTDYGLMCLGSDLAAYFSQSGALDAYTPAPSTILYIALGVFAFILVTR